MRLLVDEQLGPALIAPLRADGHDVLWVRDIARGAPDDFILAMAAQNGRVVITANLDFGELAVRKGLSHAGIVVLRLPRLSSEQLAARAVEVLRLHGHRTRVEPGAPGTLVSVDAQRVLGRRAARPLPPASRVTSTERWSGHLASFKDVEGAGQILGLRLEPAVPAALPLGEAGWREGVRTPSAFWYDLGVLVAGAGRSHPFPSRTRP